MGSGLIGAAVNNETNVPTASAMYLTALELAHRIVIRRYLHPYATVQYVQ